MVKASNSTKEPTSLKQSTRFPFFQATSLAGTQVTLPDETMGSVTLILIAFKREAQAMIDSWLNPYLKEFSDKPGFTFYEIPMIEGPWWRLFAKSIDNGMRLGIPHGKHHHVVTFYGNAGIYVDTLGMANRSHAYAFLLDTQGDIRWQGKGFATRKHIGEMISMAYRLDQESRN